MPMSRPIAAVVAAGALTTMSAVVATNAEAAPGSALDRTTYQAAHPAGTVALLAAGDADFQAVKGLTGSKPHKTRVFDLMNGHSVATTVNPVDGKDGLLCTDLGRIYRVRHLRTDPTLDRPAIDASTYTGEGDSAYGFFCGGVAVHGSFGLAMGNAQGALQLIRRHGEWKIDRRVQFHGVNESGDPHRPGWIRFPDTPGGATLFDNVAIAPTKTPSGKYLAVAMDRSDGALWAIIGVGTAHPRVLGSMETDKLRNLSASEGNGVISFIPGKPDRAMIGTATGFALLNLREPLHPQLRAQAPVGDGSVTPTSIAVSGNGNHLAVAVGDTVYGYGNVHDAIHRREAYRLQTSFTMHDTGVPVISDLAYTADDTLVVLHGDEASSSGWHLTLVRNVPKGHHAIQGSVPTTAPFGDGSMSVWPTR